jgi:adenylate cyclase
LIVIDVVFAGRTTTREDQALIAAIRAARPVLLATVASPGASLLVPAGVRDPTGIGARLGSVAVRNDPDGEVREMVFGDAGYQSLAVAAAAMLGRGVSASKFPALIDYRGGPGTFATYSLADVLNERVPSGAFRGRVVMVGITDPGEKDLFPTPASGRELAGVEIHANSLATILGGFPLAFAPHSVDVVLVLLLGLLPGLVASRLSAAWGLVVSGALLALFVVGVQLAFNAGTVVSFVYPGLALVLSALGALAAELVVGTVERRDMARVFARFVPEPVVKDVLSRADEDLRLGATTVEASVLFCDLRGFSRFAESRSAATVIATLNRYLTEMSQAIRRHGGTVVSYEGDGIMAVFGAPLEQDDHAARALAAAREMAGERRERFNAWVSERTPGTVFRLGVGVSSGPVTSGCVGSEERVEYAAVGDTTNVAARLQSKSRDTREQVLISEATYVRVLPEPTDLAYVGEFVLTGRRTATKVYGTAPSD